MPKDFIIFLKYIFNFRGFLTELKEGVSSTLEPKNVANLLLLTAIFSLLFKKNIMAIACILGVLIIYLRVTYVGGEHRYWYKQKLKNEVSNEPSREQENITQ